MQINHGLSPADMGMFVVAPAASFLHHHHHQHFHYQNQPTCISFDGSNPAAAAGLGVGVGVIPLLSDDLLLSSGNRGRGGGGLQWWLNQPTAPPPPGHDSSGSSAKNSPTSISQNLLQLQGGGAGGVATSPAAATCQDCGNQAKKDCVHRRCRSCCKSRGLGCATHVKSTWVSAARRRERQHATLSTSSSAAVEASCSQSVSSGAKKPRLVIANNSQTSTSNNTAATTPRSFDTGDSGVAGSMPKQVTAPAEFKCVRVCPVDGGEDDEYAYQAVVRIGGHVFKGFLYNQGLDNYDDDHAGKDVHHSGLFPDMSDLNLGGRGSSTSNVILGSTLGRTDSVVEGQGTGILAESHDVFGGASVGGGGMIGIGGGANFGIGNLFQ